MNKREFPRLGESCYEEVLPNGMLLRIVPKRGFAKKYAFLAVNFGAIDTSFTLDGTKYRVPDGIAHYLEHKMFDLPEENAMNLFAAHGASPNAFTSYGITAYYFSCTQDFEENLRTLLSMVLTPYFTEKSVEKERGIIAQEIRMYEDSADSRVYEDLFENMFAEHPIRVPIAGTVESIGEITAQMLYDCYNAFYQPANMMLCIAADVDQERICELVKELTPQEAKGVPVRDYGAKEEMRCVRPRSQRTMTVSMPAFSVGFKCESVEEGEEVMREEIIGDIAAEILCGESSALYSQLYESGLIDAGFSAGFEGMKGASLLSAGGDSKDPNAVYQAILKEAERISKEGFELSQFERLKKSALGRRTRDLDGFESVCYRNCAYYFDGMDYYRFPEIYASVTPEAVQGFITRVVREERATMAIILPKEEME
ncbi:MAG: insulinase family protein [Ruminococcaceae bacterium]|nr:insulinase family protein [Oscillospiraceae bacterium]